MRNHVQPRAWWVAIVAGLASYIDAAAITGFATSLVIYQGALGLTAAEIGAASATLTAAIAVGALGGGRLGDQVGRRPIFLSTMAMIIVAAFGISTASSFALLAVAAVILGLAVGADLPVSLAAIAEAATDQNRGQLLVFSNLLWVLGVVANNVLSAIVGDLARVGVQVLFAHVAIVAFLALLGRVRVPESTLWLDARGSRILHSGAVRSGREARATLRSTHYRTPLVALLVFYSLTNLAANTSGQFGRYVFVNFGGVSVAEAALVALVSVPFVVTGLLLFMRVVDTARRMRYFAAGAACAVASPLILAIFGVSRVTYALSIIAGAIGVAFAFEAIMKVWTQESFPTLVRSTAQGLIIGVARFSASAFAAFTPLLMSWGTTPVYVFLAIAQLVGVTTAWCVFRRRPLGGEFGGRP